MLKVEDIIAYDKFITYIMEETSFNDTIDEIEDVVDSSYPHNQRVITVNSINMYAAIDNYRRDILKELAIVNTKYKTIDKKIKPVTILLPEDGWRKMKWLRI
jgi:hypothetical protein